MKQAIIYARFSSDKQAKGNSIERQVELAKVHIARNEWRHIDIISDEAKSAYHGANRIEGSSLFTFETEARAGMHHGKVLVAENIDRLTRQGPKEAAQLIWSLNSAGVDVATFHDSMIYRAGETGDMTEIIMLVLKAQLAHEESDKKSQRTNASWAKRFQEIRNGRRDIQVGRAPNWLRYEAGYGYVVIEERAALIREIVELYLAGDGISLIVKRLNQRGEPVWSAPQRTRHHANGWYLPTIHKLLYNRALFGEYRTLKGEMIAEDFFPAVIDYPTFARIHAKIETKQRSGGNNFKTMNNLLADLVVCNSCGRKMGYEHKGKIQKYTKKDGSVSVYQRKPYQRLRCDTNRRGAGCTNGTTFEYQKVESIVIDRVLDFAMQGTTENPKIKQLTDELTSKRNKQMTLGEQVERIVDAIIEPSASPALSARLLNIEAEKKNVTTEIETLNEQLETEKAKPSAHADQRLVRRLRQDIESDDLQIKTPARRAVNAALKRVMTKIFFDESGVYAFEIKGHGGFRYDRDGVGIEPFGFDAKMAKLRGAK